MNDNEIAMRLAAALMEDGKSRQLLNEWLGRDAVGMESGGDPADAYGALREILRRANDGADEDIAGDSQADVVVGLLAEMRDAFNRCAEALESRMDSLEERQMQWHRDVLSSMQRRDSSELRMDSIDKRHEAFIDELEKEAKRHRELMERMNWRISVNERNYVEIRRKLDLLGIRTLKI